MHSSLRPSPAMVIALVSFLVLLGGLTAAAAAEPAEAARCLGHRATIVGSAKDNRIQGTDHKDVIAAKGGNDVIDGRRGGDIVCGGAGRDKILGADSSEKLIGGRGSDYLEGDRGNDLLVGDQFNPFGDAKRRVGRDSISGGEGRDHIVGDNLARGDATGGRHDEVCPVSAAREEADRTATRSSATAR